MNAGPTQAAISQKHLDEASATAKKARQRLEEVQSENREAHEKFHNNLALFSGGTIALSITFLGYLKSLSSRLVVWPKLLIASWILLLICLLTALFHSHFYSFYSYFFAAGEYLDSLVGKYRTTANAMETLELVNLTEEQKQAEQRKLLDIAGSYSGKQMPTKKRERIYFWLFVWSGRVARLACPIGMMLLVLFAIKNI